MVISLPCAFVKKYNLQKSEELEVIESGSEIRIKTTNEISELNYVEMNDIDLLTNRIDLLYSCGIDQIHVKITDKESIAKLQKTITEKNLDYEIFFISEKSCILEAIKKIDSDQFDNLLRRVFLIMKQDNDLMKPTLEKLLNICNRIVYKCGYKSHTCSILVSNLIVALKQMIEFEDLAGLSERLYDLYYKYNENNSMDIKNYLSEIKDVSLKNIGLILVDTIDSLNLLTKKYVPTELSHINQ